MKFTGGGFKKWGYETAETEFADFTFTMNQYSIIKNEKGEEAANAAYKNAAQPAPKPI